AVRDSYPLEEIEQRVNTFMERENLIEVEQCNSKCRLTKRHKLLFGKLSIKQVTEVNLSLHLTIQL
ncbi:hypothetical protein, partial [Herbiconiux daphne]